MKNQEMNETPPTPRSQDLTARSGLQRLAVHRVTLPPGARSSIPHAESLEDEVVYVLKGEPHAWINGFLSKLHPGNAAIFPSGTGIAHSFLNNTTEDIELLVVGERTKPNNKYIYPANPELRDQHAPNWWHEAPVQKMGPHNGLPGPVRPEDLAAERPTCVVDAPTLPRSQNFHYPTDDEKFAYTAGLSRPFSLNSFGLWYEVLKPGTRSSWPHAHSIEEEFTFVLDGELSVWLNGEITKLGPGDAIAFVPGTNDAHVLINDTDRDVAYLMLGDSSDEDRVFYPMHPAHNLACERYGALWKSRPEKKLGPHPGLPAAPSPESLRMLRIQDKYPVLEVFRVERDGRVVGEASLAVTADDPTSCSVRWRSTEDLMGDVADLIQHYLKNARKIEGVEFLFGEAPYEH